MPHKAGSFYSQVPLHSSSEASTQPAHLSATAVVLAAGAGTRMKSKVPKVLHKLCGRPLLVWVLDAAVRAGISDVVVVVGKNKPLIEDALQAYIPNWSGIQIRFAEQNPPRGTGDAVRAALEVGGGLRDEILVLNGDCPLIRRETIAKLLGAHQEIGKSLTMLTSTMSDPTGYGRILRSEKGLIRAVREEKDCTDKERALKEVNPGYYLASRAFLEKQIPLLESTNAQGEFYLTDIVEGAAGKLDVHGIQTDIQELQGINNRFHLAEAEKEMRRRIVAWHASTGVSFADTDQVWISGDSTIEVDAEIGPGVQLRGSCHIGQGARIEAGCVLEDTQVAENAHLRPYTVASRCSVGPEAVVGPFAHLRPGTELASRARVGNFVEAKNTKLGQGSKANHLSYIGDAVIGEGSNIGAGTIFCNYDGFRKHTTTIEDEVFVGSDSQIVAPVRIGKGAYVGTGTTVTKDVPEDSLALSRTKQINKEGYASRLRARLKAALGKT